MGRAAKAMAVPAATPAASPRPSPAEVKDGSGWYEWSTVGGAFEVLRFRWTLHGQDHLELIIEEYLTGTWTVDGKWTHHRVQRQRRESKDLITGFVIHVDLDALGRPVTVLELDKRVGLANRYALISRNAQATDEPIRASEAGVGREVGWPFPP